MSFCTRLALAVALTAALLPRSGHAAHDPLLPAPRLRPADTAKFSSGSAKIGPLDIAEFKACLRTLERDDLARLISDKVSLELLSTNALLLAQISTNASFKVQEWTLNRLGERSPAPARAIPTLLTVVTNRQFDEHVRALAARVVTLAKPDPQAIGVLVTQLAGASPELQALLLELLGDLGAAAQPFIGQLTPYLRTPSAEVQVNALRAIVRIEGVASSSGEPDAARVLLAAAERQRVTQEQQEWAAAVLEQDAPLHLECAALAALAFTHANERTLPLVLARLAHPDPFVATLAANALRRMRLAPGAAELLGNALLSESCPVRTHAAIALRRIPGAGAAVTNVIAAALSRAGEKGAPLPELTALIELVRSTGRAGQALGPALAALLPEQSPVYRQLFKGDVHHLRAWMFATLAEIGVPKEALPAIMDGLANTQDEHGTMFAAAARAAAALGPDAAEAVPFLLRPFEGSMEEQFISLESFDPHTSPSGEYTTCELEALRALERIGPAATAAVPVLRAFVERPVPPLANRDLLKRVPHPQKEARRTIAALEAAHKNGAPP